MRPGPKARPFWSQVAFGRGCWLWNGGSFGNGYGRAHVSGVGARGAHRIAYELTVGEIPEGLVVMHRCDNRACVRPDHLMLGTPAENMRDMVEKGRSLRGQLNLQSKLDEQRVREIRTALAAGETKAAVARRERVSEAAVWSVATGRAWGWVE